MALEFTQLLLLSAQSTDAKVRNEAETTLCQFRDQNLQHFLVSLSFEFSNVGKPTDSRILAGIVLKNSLDARWVTIKDSLKSQIKNNLLDILGSSLQKLSHTAAQVVSKIASIEVPRKEWPELFRLLHANMTQPDSPASLKQATLETLGYVCAKISNKDLVQDEVEYILEAITHGMDVSEQNTEVCLAAVRALYIALGLEQTDSRIVAGIVLKNSLDARWVAINNSLKSQIKKNLLNILGSSIQELSHTAAQVVSKIASIEVPPKEWPELFGLLAANMAQPDRPASLKQATLETLGYVCAKISNKDLVQDEVEYILEAITHGMDVSEQNTEVCLAAVRALYIALGLEQTDSRIVAGIVLKNSLDARWVAINNSLKSQIKKNLLNILGSSIQELSHTAAQVVSKIASIEVPPKEWPELFGLLAANMAQPDRPASLKQATLETLGYVCAEISNKDLVEDEVDCIFEAIIDGIDVPEQNTEVCLAAVRALYIALGLEQANFLSITHRYFIVKVICNAAMAGDKEIREAVFGCLVSIASTYYNALKPYMRSIIQLTSKAFNGHEEAVVLKALDFWSAICDKEMEIQHSKLQHYYHLIEEVLSALVPILLDILKQDVDQYKNQDQEDGIRNSTMAGVTCLRLVARTVGDAVVPHVLPFVIQNITKKLDWSSPEAATYALGSILEGPNTEKILPNLTACLFVLLDEMEDHNNHMKNAAAWTLSRMFELVHLPATPFSAVIYVNLKRIKEVLINNLQDAPHVAERVCGAIYFLVKGYQEAGPKSSELMPYVREIISSLTESIVSTNSKIRSSAYKALIKVIMCLNLTYMSNIIVELLSYIMSKLEQTLNLQIISSDDREKQGELQASFSGVLQAIIHKLCSVDETKPEILKVADQIIQLFLHVFESRNYTIHEEDMLIIGALAYATGPNFGKYMQEFYEYLVMGLLNLEDYQVCGATVDVVGIICRALDCEILPYSEGVMPLLLDCLSSDELHMSVKPLIFTCFGDIAIAIGEYFVKHLSSALVMMQSASEECFKLDNNDKEMIDYGNQLKCSILECYTLFLLRFPELMMSHIPDIQRFLKSVVENPRDKSVTMAAQALLYRLADAIGSNINLLQLFTSDSFCVRLVNECFESNDEEMKRTARWIQKKAEHLITSQSPMSLV
ncbi:hypothetical protein CASFOL_036381 [Castilleja foliolosa]|uniref:Importin N-terminal domain-containing protein n=1 Tax=Castilleja foliolosa TaxID=1961234 RepID=A0ABD3BW91_9LAMI